MSSDDCSTSSILSQQVTIIYATVYTLFLIIVSVYSFNFLKKYDKKFIDASCIKKFKIWWLDVWKRRKCYVPIVAHIFDQVTDVSVAMQFYFLAISKSDNGNWTDCNGLNIWYLFILTILSMCVYRIISSWLIYLSTKAIGRFFIQLLDLELLRALYINYLCDKVEPSNPQRWITTLEATLESSPQALIQLIYLVKTDTFNSSPLVVISLISSLWCIIAKLVSDDEVIVIERAKQINFKFKCPQMLTDTFIGFIYVIFFVLGSIIALSAFLVLICIACLCCICLVILHRCYDDDIIEDSIDTIVEFFVDIDYKVYSIFKLNTRFKWISLFYILRVLWRILDITSHILLMTLIWIVIGGTTLTFKVIFESICVLLLCVYTMQWELLFAIIAIVVSTTTDRLAIISISIAIYRTVTNIIFMILISIWLYVDFECWRCTDYNERLSSSVFSIFIYVWIAIIISPIYLFLLIYFDAFKAKTSTSRNLQKMIVSNNYDGILEMQLYAGKYDIYDEKHNNHANTIYYFLLELPFI